MTNSGQHVNGRGRTSLAAIGLAILTLTGCASTPAPTIPETSQGALDPTNPADRNMMLGQCLQAKGWDVEIDSEGAGMELPKEQVDQYQASVDECDSELGFEVRQLTPDEYASLYQESVDMNTCLSERGYPTQPAPSEQVFADTYTNAPWLPWSGLPEGATEAALAACPPPAPIY